MSHSELSQRVVPAQLGFLAIYNPSLGTTDETLENQIVYYSSAESAGDRSRKRDASDSQTTQDAIREQNNEQLRQIGLAQGMVEFGRSFSSGKSVDSIETAKSRIVLHELESGWWILASINLTVLPGTSSTPSTKGKSAEQQRLTEHSSREVKPPILLLGDLLRAHSTFLLHHASSMSALFVRTRRSKFMGILGRYWDTFLSTWNVLMHGNPANSLYGGIKIAACGELGMGVGEEERGSGEREVLEGFVGRIDGLVDVTVSKFGDSDSPNELEVKTGKEARRQTTPTEPWLGSGNEPAAEDGAIFLGTGALSRKSLRDISHWMEDLYKWGPYAYGVVDNPTSNRRVKKQRTRPRSRKKELSLEATQNSRKVYGISLRDKAPQSQSSVRQESMSTIPPTPIDEEDPPGEQSSNEQQPPLKRAQSSLASTDSESGKTNKFVQYLKLGYGTHWSLGGPSGRDEQRSEIPTSVTPRNGGREASSNDTVSNNSAPPEIPAYLRDDSLGHYLIGLIGDIEEDDDGDPIDIDPESYMRYSKRTENDNKRLLLRTLTVELEREVDARAETEISIDLGQNENDRVSSITPGSEHTGTSNTSFESQDRNKTKKLRVLVYVNKPFMFVFLFELRTDALALSSLYRSLHYQIAPLIKPLLKSTSFRASRPEITPGTEDSSPPIYDLVWDPQLLTITSTIPNIPDPYQVYSMVNHSLPWSRIEALNTHMQILNTYIAITSENGEMERTCKTSRGWWVVWTQIPDPGPSTSSLASGRVNIPTLIAEDSTDSAKSDAPMPGASRGTSTFGASMYSGAAHPFLEVPSKESAPKNKEVFLIRRASDYVAKAPNRVTSGSTAGQDAGWAGIGIDTKRYIESLLNLNQ